MLPLFSAVAAPAGTGPPAHGRNRAGRSAFPPAGGPPGGSQKEQKLQEQKQQKEIYLDNSATTRQLDSVTAAMVTMMRDNYGNPSSLHHRGLLAEQAVKEARRQAAQALGVRGGTLVFTSGGTEADNMAVAGVCAARRRLGRRIITTRIEHPAVLEAFRRMEEQGFETVYLDVDGDGRVDPAQLDSVMDDETILISVMQVNNEVGTVQPLDEIAAVRRNALLHSDCVQGFGRLPLPARADLWTVSGHKIHGPKGSGALCWREGVRVLPLLVGGGQENGLRSGTENTPAIVGFGAAAAEAAQRLEENSERMRRVGEHLRRGILEEIPDVRVNTPEKGSAPGILNVSFLGTRAEVLLHTLEEDGIYVSTGAACSSHHKGGSHVLRAMGRSQRELESALRFSLSGENTEAEMEVVVDRLKNAVGRFRRLGRFR